MAAKVAAELAVKAPNFEKLEAAFNKVIEATGQRIQSLDRRREESRAADGEGPDDAEDAGGPPSRIDRGAAAPEDSQNEILKLHAQKTDLETQRERELQQARVRSRTMRAARCRRWRERWGATRRSSVRLPAACWRSRHRPARFSLWARRSSSSRTRARGWKQSSTSPPSKARASSRASGARRTQHGQARGIRHDDRCGLERLGISGDAARHDRRAPQ